MPNDRASQTDQAQLRDLARAAYERGRARQALTLLWFVAPLVLVSLVACGVPALSFGLGATLAALVVFLEWRGQELGRGARVGLMAGSVGFLLPILLRLTGLCCRLDVEVVVCVGSGIGAGLMVANRIYSSPSHEKRAFALAAGLVAALAASLGCAFLGLGGVLGVAAGVCLVASPALLMRSPA